MQLTKPIFKLLFTIFKNVEHSSLELIFRENIPEQSVKIGFDGQYYCQ